MLPVRELREHERVFVTFVTASPPFGLGKMKPAQIDGETERE